MKALLIGEFKEGKVVDSTYELVAAAAKSGAESAMFIVGNESNIPAYNGKLYLADAGTCGEYNPDLHKKLILDVIEKENPDQVYFVHSSYGWDLAPRIAAALKAGQISEVIDFNGDAMIVPSCNAKMVRQVKSKTSKSVITIQSGAFSVTDDPSGTPTIEKVDFADVTSALEFTGYELAEKADVDLSKAEIIVSAGRGIGKQENIEMIMELAKAIGGEVGASRPLVDAGWIELSHQVGITGQTVTPKLYLACGISGAIQHLSGMKKSEYIIAINTDKDAPIGEVADVLVVADVKQLVPALIDRLKG